MTAADTWINTWEEHCALSVCPETGLVAAAGATQSVTLYQYREGSGSFEVFMADTCSRNAVSCLPFHALSQSLVVRLSANSQKAHKLRHGCLLAVFSPVHIMIFYKK